MPAVTRATAAAEAEALVGVAGSRHFADKSSMSSKVPEPLITTASRMTSTQAAPKGS